GPITVTEAQLGTGDMDHPYSTAARIQLLGPLSTTETDLVADPNHPGRFMPSECNTNTTYDARRTRGYRDINGDGIPDAIRYQTNFLEGSHWKVALGTGTGFGPYLVVNSPVGLELSIERNKCNPAAGPVGSTGEEVAATISGFYELDGDGQPEVVALNF